MTQAREADRGVSPTGAEPSGGITITSTLDLRLLLRALNRTPSVFDTRPVCLEATSRSVQLLDRRETTGSPDDQNTRDHALSCGAAVTNAIIESRAQGWSVRPALLPDARRPELVARLTVTDAVYPTGGDATLHRAIYQRHTHGTSFGTNGLSWRDRDGLVRAVSGTGLTVHAVRRDECTGLADLLGYAQMVCREDPNYLRETAAWFARRPGARSTRSVANPPVNPATLADRLASECLLFLFSEADTRSDWILAGAGMQRAWLAAVAGGFVASVVTRPWRLPEVRAALRDMTGQTAVPQLALRVGRPRVGRSGAGMSARAATGAPWPVAAAPSSADDGPPVVIEMAPDVCPSAVGELCEQLCELHQYTSRTVLAVRATVSRTPDPLQPRSVEVCVSLTFPDDAVGVCETAASLRAAADVACDRLRRQLTEPPGRRGGRLPRPREPEDT